MPNKQRLPAPRFEYWKNAKKEFNYRTIGKNGKAIGGEVHQGFKRLAKLRNNITAHAGIFGVGLDWSTDGKSCVTSSGELIALIEVKK
jgi:hypothetical protein